MNKLSKIGIIASSLMLFAGSANAADYCVPGGTNPDGMSITDLTFNGDNSADCYGVVLGNDNAGINGLGLTWGTDWTFLAKDDSPGSAGSGTGSYEGLDFQLAADAGKLGSWTLTITDTNGPADLNLPTSLDFVAALKGSDRYGLWFLDDVTVDASNTGTWKINFLGASGRTIPDLSHMSLYVRDGGGTIIEVPEPTSTLLLASGLLGLAFMRRRYV